MMKKKIKKNQCQHHVNDYKLSSISNQLFFYKNISKVLIATGCDSFFFFLFYTFII